MAKNDPFGFDIRVSVGQEEAPEGSPWHVGGISRPRTASATNAGCEETGQYRAPKSPDVLDDYYWFARIMSASNNLKWNFFHGVTEEENGRADQTRTGSGTGRRNPSANPARSSAPGRGSGSTTLTRSLARTRRSNPGKSVTGTRKLPPKERKAVEILEARDHWTKAEIRKQVQKPREGPSYRT